MHHRWIALIVLVILAGCQQASGATASPNTGCSVTRSGSVTITSCDTGPGAGDLLPLP
jgi:hypothetical protein